MFPYLIDLFVEPLLQQGVLETGGSLHGIAQSLSDVFRSHTPSL